MKNDLPEVFVFQGGITDHGLQGPKKRRYLEVLHKAYGLFLRFNGFQYLYRYNEGFSRSKGDTLVLVEKRPVAALDGLEVFECDDLDFYSYVVQIIETTEGIVLLKLGSYGGLLDDEWDPDKFEQVAGVLGEILNRIGDDLEFG